MRLLQLRDERDQRFVAVLDESGRAQRLRSPATVYELAASAIEAGSSIAAFVERSGFDGDIDVFAAEAEGRILPPIDHPDPAHLLITGSGLTHVGSAAERDRMHAQALDASPKSDSMRMFELGLKGGRPAAGEIGVQPEWFYKGDGSILAPPGQGIRSPGFALDGGDEAELAGIYIIGPAGATHRIGFALGNEFSDHVMEKENYLYLGHSKLRACALGPELLLGEAPQEVEGAARIRRGDAIVWEASFLSGEAHMCHSIGNLEHHHFKYDLFRRPGDVHVHFFGAATLSFKDNIRAAPGDIFEIEARPFQLALRNPLEEARPVTSPVRVRVL